MTTRPECKGSRDPCDPISSEPPRMSGPSALRRRASPRYHTTATTLCISSTTAAAPPAAICLTKVQSKRPSYVNNQPIAEQDTVSPTTSTTSVIMQKLKDFRRLPRMQRQKGQTYESITPTIPAASINLLRHSSHPPTLSTAVQFVGLVRIANVVSEIARHITYSTTSMIVLLLRGSTSFFALGQ